MFWYILILLLSVVIDFFIWYAFSTWYLKDDFVIIIGDNLKRFFYTVLIALVLSTLLCSVKLYKMSSCSVKGYITNASTQYSWIMDQCQAKNSSGVYVDIERTRGIPSDDAHDNETH